jgi:hypothetical protein
LDKEDIVNNDNLFDDMEKVEMTDIETLFFSSKEEIIEFRTMLENWFLTYPDEGKADLKLRIRSTNSIRGFQSAFFELFLSQLLRILGCKLIVHPPIPESSKSPDFLVTSSCGNKFYLEARVATDLSDEKAANEERKRVFFETIKKINSPNFNIRISQRDNPRTPPKGNKIREKIEEELKWLDPYADEIYKKISEKGANARPRLPFEHDGWKIVIIFEPRPPKARRNPDVNGTILRTGAVWVTSSRSIRKSIKKKKPSRYGKLEYPYIIAINALGYAGPENQFIEALFGKSHLNLNIDELRRTGDGAWIKNRHPINTRISGVLAVQQLPFLDISKGRLELYLNPFAKKKYSSDLLKLPRYKLVDDNYQFHNGISLADIFNGSPVI